MQMDAGLDTGPMIDVVDVPIGAARDRRRRCTTSSPQAGAQRSSTTLRRLGARRRASPSTPQPAEGVDLRGEDRPRATRRSTGRGAVALDRRVRAFDPVPGAHATLRRRGGQDLARGCRSRAASRAAPGEVVARAADGIDVACGDVRRRRAADRSRCSRRAGGAWARRLRRRRGIARRALRRAGRRGWPRRWTQSQRQAADAIVRVLDGATLARALEAVGRRARRRRARFVHEIAYGTLRHWGTLEAIVRALAHKPLADRDSSRSSPSRSTSSSTCAPSRIRGRRPRGRRGRRRGASPQAKGWSTRCCAASCANARACSRRVERDAGRALVASALVDRARARRLAGALGARSSPPATSIRRSRCAPTCASATREALARTIRGSRHRVRSAAGEAGMIVDAAAAGARACPGSTTARSQRAGRSARSSPRRSSDAHDGRARARRMRGARRQDHARPRARRRRRSPRSTATTRGSRACARTSRGSALARTARARGRGRRVGTGVAGGMAGPTTASSPTCRAPRRASCAAIRTASGCAARATSRPSPPNSARSSTRCGGCLARGGTLLYATCSVFADENEAQVAAFTARHPDALRESLTFRAGVDAPGVNSCLRAPGAHHNQDGFFYALFPQGVTRCRAARLSPGGPIPDAPPVLRARDPPACRPASLRSPTSERPVPARRPRCARSP